MALALSIFQLLVGGFIIGYALGHAQLAVKGQV